MRILQLVQKPQRRGAEIFAFQLSNALRKKNHTVKIVYLYGIPGNCQLPVQPEDDLLQSNEKHFFEKLPGWNFSLLSRLEKILAGFRPDVVQVNAARTIKYGALLRRRSKKPWVLVYRNIGDPQVWMRGGMRKFFYRHFVFPQLDGIVAVSSNSYTSLHSFYGDRYRIQRIPRAVDTESLSPRQTREAVRESLKTPLTAPVLIFIGSLTPEKRPDRFLRVFKEIHSTLPEAHAWMIGEGILRNELSSLAENLHLQSRVRFLSVQAEVASLIHAADLLLLTSDTEGIPGVVLEAAALEIPSVSTNVGGVTDCIVDHQTGRLADPENEKEMAACALELLQNPELRQTMGKHAKDFVLENFNLNKIADSYLKFYEELLVRHNSFTS
ncbi:glycosyltransferase family 4 protein [bacterium]|nr:glycosyltransferase family 4 protein [bacterium]